MIQSGKKGPRSILRDPPAYAVAQGRLDPDLPICICGEQVAVAHQECIAIFDAGDSGGQP